MKIKLSATFEGRCSMCKKETTVFTAGDEDTKKAVTLCKNCSDKLGDVSTADVIERFGRADESAFKEGIRIEKN